MFTVALLLTAGLQVELKTEAQARGTELHLAEIATVAGEDALVERARELGVGYTPAPGFSRRLDRWSLERELKQAFPGVDLSVTGASSCRVVPAVETVRADEILGAAQAQLAQAFAASDVTYGSQTVVQDVQVPAGRETRRVRARIDTRLPQTGTVSVPVEILVDDAVYRTIWTSWSVETWRELPVLVRDIAPGDAIGRADFRRQRVKVGVGAVEAYLTEAAADGAVAVRGLQAGTAVTNRDVRRQLMVRRGDTVQLQVTKGSITATSTAVAAEDGHLGDKVRVVTSNQRELRAVVLGRELVTMDLGVAR